MNKHSMASIIRNSLGGAFGGGFAKEEKEESASSKWFKAVEKSDRSALKKLMKADFNINCKNAKGQTALLIATYNNDVKLAGFLIEAGANVNAQDETLNSPFLYAAAEGYLPILQLIGDRGNVKAMNRFGGIGIIPASERANLETLTWLLENTASDVNHTNHMGWSALIEAIILGDGTEKYVKTVQLLLKHGASPYLADRDGVTPIEHAEKLGYTKILKLLKA